MQTRSQTKNLTKRIKYEVNIDFDEATTYWKANKLSIGNGCYKYICGKKTTTGNFCNKKPLNGCDFCSIHNI